MRPDFAALQFLLLVFSGWVNREQQAVIAYLREENSVLREQLGGKRLRFTDAQRRRLAVKGKALGRKLLAGIAGVATPDTILRWYRGLVAQLGNRLIEPANTDVEAPDRPVRRRERLGGMLSFYYRDAA